MATTEDFNFQEYKIQGLKVNYYMVCKRKLWLFSKGISMESGSEKVGEGALLHENSFKKSKHKEVLIDDNIRIDVVDNDKIKEVKLSSSLPLVDRFQVVYYLYYLKQLGINKTAEINYIKENKKQHVTLSEDDESFLVNALIDIQAILSKQYPPYVQHLPYCTKCAYYEYCYVSED